MQATQDLSVVARHGGHGLALLCEVERSRNATWDALAALDAEVK